MSSGKFLIVCALCVGSIDAASAMDADSQDMGAMQHSLDSGSSSHDGAGGGSGGDALGLSRENVTPSSSSSPSNNENCPTGSQSSPQRKSRTTLGWQSLLPGSLQ